MDITKVIIPAIDQGISFLPTTKTIPTELLPLCEKPSIQYLLEEALESDIKNNLFITNKAKHALVDFVDESQELLSFLKERHQEGLLADIEKIIKQCNFSFIRQKEALGIGHALSLAKDSIGKEYFGLMMPHDIICSKQPALAQLIRVARQEKASVIAVQEVPSECFSTYDMVDVKKQITPNLFQISQIVRKPDHKDAPSSLAVVGRFVLSPKIFIGLDHMNTYSIGEELHLSDAINSMMHNSEKVFAYKIQGMRYDVSTPVGWIKAVIGTALQNPHYHNHIKSFLQSLNTADSFLYNQSKNIEHSL